MDSLRFSSGNTSIVIDKTGFSHNGRRISWSEIQKCEEALITKIDQLPRRYLRLFLPSGIVKIEHWPDDAFMALRIVLKELLPDKVTLDGPRYLKSGPEECEFTISIARFLNSLELHEASKFAYKHAIELIEYFHNLKHESLVEPLTALSALIETSAPDQSAALLKRAQEIRSAPAADKSFIQGLVSARSNKDKIKEALEEFRKKHKREPRPAEKARILKEIE